MIYTIYRDITEIKYNTPGKLLQNTSENLSMGETAAWDKIDEGDMVGCYQARRYLSTPSAAPLNDIDLDSSKIYVTKYFINHGSNAELWMTSHRNNELGSFFLHVAKVFPKMHDTLQMVYNQNWLIPHNMFIMSKDRFTQWREFHHQCFKDYIPLNDVPKICSLLTERLLTAWILFNYPLKDIEFVTAVALDKKTGARINITNAVAD